MANGRPRKNKGLRKLIKQGRALFRRHENTAHYSRTDYQAAEKKFIKICVLEGRCGSLAS